MHSGHVTLRAFAPMPSSDLRARRASDAVSRRTRLRRDLGRADGTVERERERRAGCSTGREDALCARFHRAFVVARARGTHFFSLPACFLALRSCAIALAAPRTMTARGGVRRGDTFARLTLKMV